MIICKASTRDGMQIRRYQSATALEAPLRELMRLYDRLGGAVPEADAELDAAIERCLGERGGARDRQHAQLQQLMRARDLHRYVLEDADLVSLKLALCERVLYHQSAPERWAAIRELLLAHLPRIFGGAPGGLGASLEPVKRALSDRASRLGKLLVTAALFNLELTGEAAPPNLVLHFRRGAFPQHCWEVCARDGRAAHLGTVEHWTPAEPLARWEYLAADLAHALYRSQHAARAARHRAAGDTPAAALLHPPAPVPETIYCRFEADATGDAAPQLDLFPVEPDALLAGLLRRVHRHLGPEGVKLLAVLLSRLDGAHPGAALDLALPELAAEAGLGDASARGLRSRVQRLERVVDALAQVELTRVARGDDGESARATRLLTVLGRGGSWPAGTHDAAARTASTLRVLPDPYLHDAPGGGLTAAFAGLPALLVECAGKEHPHALPLYVWLRRAWSRGDDAPVVERPARLLLDEAGIWVSETGRYRAIEALKRDLEFLREQGWLGAWRLQRSELRDAMEDRYRLLAPAASSVAVAMRPPAGAGPEALTGT